MHIRYTYTVDSRYVECQGKQEKVRDFEFYLKITIYIIIKILKLFK